MCCSRSSGMKILPIFVPMMPRLPFRPPIPPATKALVGPMLDEDTVYRFVGDVLFEQFHDADFADLYPKDGQPALSPLLLSFVLIFQALEHLSDRATAFAVAFKVAWKYALHLPLAYPGFDPTVLSEFHQRLLTHDAESRLFTAVFAQRKPLGFCTRTGIQHTDSIAALTHHRLLHRIELCVETMRTTIKNLLHHDPAWTRVTRLGLSHRAGPCDGRSPQWAVLLRTTGVYNV